jgi:hypothetical protein
MAQSKFRFVSPGIQLREIDRSQIPNEPEAVGPVIIGRAQRGPALRPVKVQNFTEFVEIFGEPLPGGDAGDVWRDGTEGIEPTYGAYAAQAWLSNGTPLTYVRLLGKEHTNSTATGTGKAGWQIGGTPDGTRGDTGNGPGALGLFVINSASATNVNMTGTLAAVWYCNTGSIELSGTVRRTNAANTPAGVSATNQTGSGVLIKSVAVGPTFTALVKDEDGTITETVNFNVKDSTAGNFVRKVFNTDPTKLTSRLNDSDQIKTYFLGESYERDVNEKITSGSAAGDCFGFIASLYADATTNYLWGRNYQSMTPAQTNWIIGQSQVSYGSSTPEGNEDLFQVIALDSGEWTQENIKISITDIRYSNEPSEPYGTFGLILRKASDSDEAPQVIESFSNLNLNPNSPNYIARRIGDAYAVWDDTDRRYRYYGSYGNSSRYVYIKMKSENGPSVPNLLPLGYKGPVRWGSFGVVSGSTTPKVNNGSGHFSKNFVGAMVETNGYSPGYNSGSAGDTPLVNVGTASFSASFEFPRTYLRDNSTQGNLNDPTDSYWGVDTTFANSSRFDAAYEDVVRGLSGLRPSTTQTAVSYSAGGFGNVIEYQYVFSLEDISYHITASTSKIDDGPSQTQEAYYHSGSYKLGNAIASSGSNSYKNLLDDDWDQFTVPMFGGFNGTDIRETDAFNNYYTSTPTMTTNSKFNSIRMAIDSCADPELVECNLIAAPGIGTTTYSKGLTSHMLDIARRRADTLAVIDIEGGYLPPADRDSYGTDSDSDNRGKASTAANSLRSRQINNSYGACYYPWVQIRDPDLGTSFFSPPSVAAIGTYAYSQRQAELWFAPAGFTRGGLTEGAGGLPIIGVTERLTSKDRDKLYENNINPIASFPAEGLVVFGQKTLQSTRSALDRVNVRRLMIHVKKEISRISARLLFDPNTQVTWNRFLGSARPFLESVKTRLGVEDYKIVLDTSTTTPDLIDRNIMYAQIFIKPTRAIEFIAIDFIITNTGASFQD